MATYVNLCQVFDQIVSLNRIYILFIDYRYILYHMILYKKQIHYIRAEKTVVLYDDRPVPGRVISGPCFVRRLCLDRCHASEPSQLETGSATGLKVAGGPYDAT